MKSATQTAQRAFTKIASAALLALSTLSPSPSEGKSPDQFVVKLPGEFHDFYPLGADPRPQIANYCTKLPPGESSGNYGSEQGYVNVIIYDPSSLGMNATDFFEHTLQQEQEHSSLSPSPLGDLCYYGPSRSAPHYSNLLACVGNKVVWAQFFNPKGKLNPEAFAQKLLEKVALVESSQPDPLSAWIEREREEISRLQKQLAELQKQADSLWPSSPPKNQPATPLPPLEPATPEQEISLSSKLNVPEILKNQDPQMAILQEQIRSLRQQIQTKERWLETISHPSNAARLRSLIAMSQEEFLLQKQETQRLAQHYSSAAREAQQRHQSAERQKALTAAEAGKSLASTAEEANKRLERAEVQSTLNAGKAKKNPQNDFLAGEGILRSTNAQNPAADYIDAETLVDQMRKAADAADAAAEESRGYAKIAEEQNLELRLIHFAESLREFNPTSDSTRQQNLKASNFPSP